MLYYVSVYREKERITTLPKYLIIALFLLTASTNVMAQDTKANEKVQNSAAVQANTENDSDWVESYNRGIFEFNYQVDKFLLKPLAKGYRAITTQDIRNRVSGTLYNIREPIVAGNHVLQGEFQKTVNNIGRFLINSTLGLGGMFDVAEGWGIPKENTNFDETLAKWCVPDGPFFMLPLIGPSTPRALVGYGVEAAADPIFWTTYQDANVSSKISYTYAAIKAISARERALDFLDGVEKNSVDFYSTIKSAYIQNRQGMNNICNPSQAVSYDFDFDADDDY